MDDSEDLDWIDARTMRSAPTQRPVIYDEEVSKIVGLPIRMNDPRLIRLVVKWKKQFGSSEEGEKMDNFMYRPECLKELKDTFTKA